MPERAEPAQRDTPVPAALPAQQTLEGPLFAGSRDRLR